MNIQILEPEKFISYDKQLYAISKKLGLNTLELSSDTEGTVTIINNEEAYPVNNYEIEEGLNNNPSLLHYAIESDLVYLRDQNRNEYLAYCRSYE